MALSNFHLWLNPPENFYQQNQRRHWLPQIKGTVWKPELFQMTMELNWIFTNLCFFKLSKLHKKWILGGLNPWANSSKLNLERDITVYMYPFFHQLLKSSQMFFLPTARQQSQESWSIHCRMTSRARGHLWRNHIDPLQSRMVRMTMKELKHITCILKHQHKCTPEIPWKLLTWNVTIFGKG